MFYFLLPTKPSVLYNLLVFKFLSTSLFARRSQVVSSQLCIVPTVARILRLHLLAAPLPSIEKRKGLIYPSAPWDCSGGPLESTRVCDGVNDFPSSAPKQ